MKIPAMAFLVCFSVFADEARVTQERTALEETCHAIVVKNNQNIGTIPTPVLHFRLARCEDVQYKGGGVVIRHITDGPMGFWSVDYFPAHAVSRVSVTPRFQ